MSTAVAERPNASVAVMMPPDFPGVAHGVPIEVYHAMPGISKSGLDAIHRSPAHYFATYLDPQRPPRAPRAGQLEGTLAHCAVLEPSEFGRRYAVLPSDAPRRPTEAQWNAKNSNADSIAAKAWWTKFNADHEGMTIITAEQYDTAMRQAESVRQLHEVVEVLDRGKPEVSALWIDPVTGVPCRCRPDWVGDMGGRRVVLLDLKTTGDASREEFARTIARKRYHVQDAFYSDGYALATGVDVLGFLFVAVESEWPYVANPLMLGERSQDQGRADYRRDLNTYARCLRDGTWPGYGQEVQLVDLPVWAFRD